jgi:hypothetical protein
MKVFDPLLGQVRYRLAPEHVRVDLNPQEGGYEYRGTGCTSRPAGAT